MIGESILELHETNASDESVKSYEYKGYQPITGTQLNSAGQITITIDNQDQFLHLHNSYLVIEGEVLKADNTRYADADLVALTTNGQLYLFSSLKITLSGQEVEHATPLLGLASYSSTYYEGCGLSQGWFPDINTYAAVNNTGFYTRQGFVFDKYLFFFYLKSFFRNNNLHRQIDRKISYNIKGPGRTTEIFVTLPPQRGHNTRQGYLIQKPNPKGSFQCEFPQQCDTSSVLWMIVPR